MQPATGDFACARIVDSHQCFILAGRSMAVTYAVCVRFTDWHSWILALMDIAVMASRAMMFVVHRLAVRGSSALAWLQEGARAAVVFCQQGSTTLRCVQVAQLAPVKGSKEKPGGQLRTDNKKPIVALAAAPCQKLEVLVLYVDGSLSSCTCSPATRVMATRWCIAVDPGTVALHQVRQRTAFPPDPASVGGRTGMPMQTCAAGHDTWIVMPCRVPAAPHADSLLSGCSCIPGTTVMATPLAYCNGPPGQPSLTGARITLAGNCYWLDWPAS